MTLDYPQVAIVVLGAGVLGAAAAWLTRRCVHIDVLRRHHEVGSAVFLQIGVMFAVLLAFVFSLVGWVITLTALARTEPASPAEVSEPLIAQPAEAAA